MKRPLLVANGMFVTLTTAMFVTPPTLDTKSSSAIQVIPVPTITNSKISKTISTNKVIINNKHKIDLPTPVNTSIPAPTNTTSNSPTPSSQPTLNNKINGSFLGDVIDISYGNLQVKITVQDNIIIDAQAVQYPNSGRSASLNTAAIAQLRQETLSVQGSAIHGVSGASYTSYGWYKSLVSALTKAGL